MSLDPNHPKVVGHRDAMLARAEHSVAQLAELAVVGMALAKEIAIRMIDGPYHPELRHCPGRSYAAVSRAVRLTYAMQAKVDEQILAMLLGEVPFPAEAPKAALAAAPRRSVAGDLALDADDGDGRHRDAADATFDCERESLVETELFDLSDFAATVEVIRADLGLGPSPLETANEPTSTEVGRSDSRRPAASRVGGEREAWSPGEIREDASPEHRDITPPRSRPDGGNRPPHFGGGRVLTAADPPSRDQP